MSMRSRRSGILAIALLLAPLAATAGDGALEINQACVATGCFPGDTPGFPVTTQDGRKYVLTGDLTVPDQNTSAVTLGAAATFDLNGFSIRGPNACSGTPTACTYSNGGSGVTLGEGSTVRNGAIVGMGGYGVYTTRLEAVEDLWIDQNGADGIYGAFSDGNVIQRCRISRNGGAGVGLAGGNASPGTLISENVIYKNAGAGVRVNSALIRDNDVQSNGGLGLVLNFIDSSSGYGGNVINGNNGGNANAQVSGGNQVGANICGADTTCP